MEPTQLILLSIFGFLAFYFMCKYGSPKVVMRSAGKKNLTFYDVDAYRVLMFCIDYLYSKTIEAEQSGKFKMSKKQKRKDKSPGTIFD